MAKSGDIFQNIVTEVVKALNPDASVNEGLWIEGPDGRRDKDVTVKICYESRDFTTLIECKDRKRPVGIGYIDALESKRRDLPVDLAVICSNSGFTEPALRKAARVGIPAITILVDSDERVKAQVSGEVVARMIRFHTLAATYQTTDGVAVAFDPQVAKFLDLPFVNWLIKELPDLLRAHRMYNHITANYLMNTGATLVTQDGPIALHSLSFDIWFSESWVSQIAPIKASTGIYDYITQIVGIGSDSSLEFEFENSKWKETTPPEFDELPAGVQRLEVGIVVVPFKEVPELTVPAVDDWVSERTIEIGLERPPSS